MLIFRSCHNTRYFWHDLAPRGDSHMSYSKTVASKTESLFTFSQKLRWRFWSKWSILKESAWLKQGAMSFGTNLTRKAHRTLPFVLVAVSNRKLLGRYSWRVITTHVLSLVLISILRSQPRTPPSGEYLGVLNYHLKILRIIFFRVYEKVRVSEVI